MEDIFTKATVYQYAAFLKTATGDTWRVWMGDNGPLIERLTPDQVREYRNGLEPRW